MIVLKLNILTFFDFYLDLQTMSEHEIRGALARIAAANKDELAMRDEVTPMCL